MSNENQTTIEDSTTPQPTASVEQTNTVNEPVVITTEDNVIFPDEPALGSSPTPKTEENGGKKFLKTVGDKYDKAKNDELKSWQNSAYHAKEGIADGGWTVIKGSAGAGSKVIAWGNDALAWACDKVGADKQAQKFENWSDQWHDRSDKYFSEAGDKAFDCGTNLTASVVVGAVPQEAMEAMKHGITTVANGVNGMVEEGKNLPERFKSSENENKHFGTDLYTNIENANNNGVPALVDATLETAEAGVNLVKSAGYGSAYCGNKIGEGACKVAGKVCDLVGWDKGQEACEKRAQNLNEKSKTNAKKCANSAYDASINLATAGEQVVQGAVIDPAKWTYKKVDWTLSKTGEFANDLIDANKDVGKAVFNVNDDNKVVQVVDEMGNRIEGGLFKVGSEVYKTGQNLEKGANDLAKKVLGVPENYQETDKKYDPMTFDDVKQATIPSTNTKIGDIPIHGDVINEIGEAKNTLSVAEIERKDAEVKAKQNENPVSEPKKQSVINQTEQAPQTQEPLVYTSEERQSVKHDLQAQHKVFETKEKHVEEKANEVPSNPQIEARVEVHEAENQQQSTNDNAKPLAQTQVNQAVLNQATR